MTNQSNLKGSREGCDPSLQFYVPILTVVSHHGSWGMKGNMN